MIVTLASSKRTIALENPLIPPVWATRRWPPNSATIEQMLAIFRDLLLQWVPGEKYAYNNSGYFLLGVVIEKVAGRKYEQAHRRELFGDRSDAELCGRRVGHAPLHVRESDALGDERLPLAGPAHTIRAITGKRRSALRLDIWLWTPVMGRYYAPRVTHMNEYIEVEFRKPTGQRLRVKRQVTGGIEFDEPDPIERTVGFQLNGRSEVTRHRMRRIAQVKGWDLGQFKLRISVEDGNIVLRGVDADALPEGHYSLRVRVEEARCVQESTSADVEQDGHGVVTVEVQTDDRSVDVDLASCDPAIERVIDDSTIDGFPASTWLASPDWRATRKACLLNLLAALRVSPSKSDNLIDDVHQVFKVFNDRAYMKVDSAIKRRVEQLVKDPKKPFYAEGPPTAAIHRLLLDEIPADEKNGFTELLSFRGEGKPSLQMVIAVPPVGLPHTYAEFDLDLANPLQDVLGFIVHVGELLDGKPTNHLDLRKALAKGKAGDFLYYSVA